MTHQCLWQRKSCTLTLHRPLNGTVTAGLLLHTQAHFTRWEQKDFCNLPIITPQKISCNCSPELFNPPLAKAGKRAWKVHTTLKSSTQSFTLQWCQLLHQTSQSSVFQGYLLFYIYIYVYKTFKAKMKLDESLRGANVSGTTGSVFIIISDLRKMQLYLIPCLWGKHFCWTKLPKVSDSFPVSQFCTAIHFIVIFF